MPESSFLEIADSIGSRLCRDAIWSGARCNWLGWALEVVGSAWCPVYRAQKQSIYDGTAGISLFLGRLFAFTQDALQKTTALAAINQAFAGIEDIPAEIQPSFYSGAAGVGYAAADLGAVLGDHRMIARGLDLMRRASAIAPGPGSIDVLGGSAGTVQALLHIANRFDRLDLVEQAENHGRVLLHAAVKSDEGWSWDTLPGQTVKHLTGYGHGAAGIGCALLQLWEQTRSSEYYEAAIQAFRYERSQFSPEQHNWPDLRSMTLYGGQENQKVFALAWCHGGPGIGLSRLHAAGLLHDEDILHDLDEALLTTARACSDVVFPQSGSLCLCHGLGGNADLLLSAADQMGRRDLRQIAENVGRAAIAQLRTEDLPWPCGVNGCGETPNLMLGLAGIGHFFLRLHESSSVPSVLLLANRRDETPNAGVSIARELVPVD